MPPAGRRQHLNLFESYIVHFKFQFVALLNALKKKMSLRASAHTGVAIPRIFRKLLMEETVSFARNHLRFY